MYEDRYIGLERLKDQTNKKLFFIFVSYTLSFSLILDFRSNVLRTLFFDFFFLEFPKSLMSEFVCLCLAKQKQENSMNARKEYSLFLSLNIIFMWVFMSDWNDTNEFMGQLFWFFFWLKSMNQFKMEYYLHFVMFEYFVLCVWSLWIWNID